MWSSRFLPKELMSRIKAVLKRSQPKQKPEDEVYTFKTLMVNPKSYEVRVDGKQVNVNPQGV